VSRVTKEEDEKMNNLEKEDSLLPVGGDGASQAVVTGQAVNLALDKNEAELAVLVLPVLLKMLTDVHGLLDQLVEVLGELGAKTVSLEEADDLVTGDVLDLGDAVGVTEDNSNLRRGKTLLGELADLVHNLLSGGLEPSGGRAAVGEGGAGNTLSIEVAQGRN